MDKEQLVEALRIWVDFNRRLCPVPKDTDITIHNDTERLYYYIGMSAAADNIEFLLDDNEL